MSSPINRGQLMHGFEPFTQEDRPRELERRSDAEDVGYRPSSEELAKLRGEQ